MTLAFALQSKQYWLLIIRFNLTLIYWRYSGQWPGR